MLVNEASRWVLGLTSPLLCGFLCYLSPHGMWSVPSLCGGRVLQRELVKQLRAALLVASTVCGPSG